MRSSRPGAFLKTPPPPPPPRSVTPAPRPAASSRLKLLVAGVDKDARGSVEATVRQAFAGRDPREPWSVSLVRLGSSWSVTLSGPGERYRSLSFSAEQHRLAEAIRAALSKDESAPARPMAPSTSTAGRRRVEDRHLCGTCQQALVVSYEGRPDEAKQPAPVACPHCWSVSHVEIGGWAAAGGDYAAEKA